MTESVGFVTARRIYRHTDLLRAMRDQRQALGMTMEDVSERSGVCERYYNKVEIGILSERRRALRASLKRTPARWGSTVRRPFQMCPKSAWALESINLCLVVVSLDMAGEFRRVDEATAREIQQEVRRLNDDPNAEPMHIRRSIYWMLESMGLTLVLMDMDAAMSRVEPDPVMDLERAWLS